jgi:hypothetical protein
MPVPTDADPLPPVATAKHLADFLHTSEQSLAQDRYLGRGVPFTRIGRRIRYLRDDVLTYLEQNRCQRADDPCGQDRPPLMDSGAAAEINSARMYAASDHAGARTKKPAERRRSQ